MKRLFFLLLVLPILCGCQKTEEIASYRIPKSRSNLDKFERKPLASGRAKAEAVPARTVAGLVERPDATWFLKISGPVDQVNLAEPVWREFFGKLKFDEKGQPIWSLPEGWSNGRASSMRFATLNLNNSEPPLELSISSLGPNQDLLGNVNRWRGQLGLAAIGESELKLDIVEFEGGSMKLFDEVGMSSLGGGPMMGGGPMTAPNGRPPMVPDMPISDATNIKFDSLSGWEQGPNSTIVKVRLLKNDGDKTAQITVVEMSAAVNEWGENVKRWLNELEMTKLTGPEIAVRTSTVEIDGASAKQLRVVEDEIDKATIAVMAIRGDSAWFIKLAGERSVVQASESEFQKFLASIKFE